MQSMQSHVEKFFDVVVRDGENPVQFSRQMSNFPFTELCFDELLRTVETIELTAKQSYLAKVYLLDWYLNSEETDDSGIFLSTKIERSFNARKEAAEYRHLEDDGKDPWSW